MKKLILITICLLILTSTITIAQETYHINNYADKKNAYLDAQKVWKENEQEFRLARPNVREGSHIDAAKAFVIASIDKIIAHLKLINNAKGFL